MSNQPARIQYLFQQYANDNCTRKELLELFQLIRDAGENETLYQSMQLIWQELSNEASLPVIEKDRIFQKIIQAAPVLPMPKRQSNWWKVAVAALFVIIAGGGIYYFTQKDTVSITETNTKLLAQLKNPEAARLNKVVLTLADGKNLPLDESKHGMIAREAGTDISHKGKQLVYASASGESGAEEYLVFNTLTTPAGMQQEIVLPDGSHVWLNAASSIRYPVSFAGNHRTVAISGEAYFEVAKDASRPFRVYVVHPAAGPNGAPVEVLGTHFNVSAYETEDMIKTTLLEGSVKVSSTQTLVPGQQAQQKKDATIQVKSGINMEEIVAWKKGELILNDVTYAEAARIIERWYNVQIKFGNPALQSCRLTVSFLKGEPINEAMDVIAAFSNMTWKADKNVITLNGKGCQ